MKEDGKCFRTVIIFKEGEPASIGVVLFFAYTRGLMQRYQFDMKKILINDPKGKRNWYVECRGYTI